MQMLSLKLAIQDARRPSAIDIFKVVYEFKGKLDTHWCSPSASGSHCHSWVPSHPKGNTQMSDVVIYLHCYANFIV